MIEAFHSSAIQCWCIAIFSLINCFLNGFMHKVFSQSDTKKATSVEKVSWARAWTGLDLIYLYTALSAITPQSPPTHSPAGHGSCDMYNVYSEVAR